MIKFFKYKVINLFVMMWSLFWCFLAVSNTPNVYNSGYKLSVEDPVSSHTLPYTIKDSQLTNQNKVDKEPLEQNDCVDHGNLV